MIQPIEGKWHGLPHYRCPHCRYDSLDRAEVVQHWQDAHAPNARRSELVGPNGEPVFFEEPAPYPVAPIDDAPPVEAAWRKVLQAEEGLVDVTTMEDLDDEPAPEPEPKPAPPAKKKRAAKKKGARK